VYPWEDPPELEDLRRTVGTNLRERLEEAAPSSDELGGNIMWALMHQVMVADRGCQGGGDTPECPVGLMWKEPGPLLATSSQDFRRAALAQGGLCWYKIVSG